MNGKMNRLRDILNRHAEIHQELLGLAEEKRLAIIANDAEKVESITLAESELVEDAEKVEKERAACVACLAEEFNLAGTPKVQEIIDSAGEEATPLQESRDRLREILEALQKRTLQNERLLQQSIEHIKGFFEALSKARTTAPVYTRIGKAYGGQMRMVDHKA